MATRKEYLTFILGQLSDLENVSFRAMMGEYILYYEGRIFGGLYDNRLLVKDVPPARRLLPGAVPEPPYPGAKGMLPVENVDDPVFLCRLVREMASALPAGKRK